MDDPITGFAARLVDEAGAQALLVVEQDFQEVFGSELLMAFAKRQRLRRLHESARPFGVLFKVHKLSLWPRPSTRSDEGRPVIGFAALSGAVATNVGTSAGRRKSRRPRRSSVPIIRFCS